MWLVALLGWPAAGLAVGLTLYGLFARRHGALLASAVVGAPFLAYLDGTPRFGGVLALSFLQFASAFLMWRRHAAGAVVCALPAPVFFGYLAFALAS